MRSCASACLGDGHSSHVKEREPLNLDGESVRPKRPSLPMEDSLSSSGPLSFAEQLRRIVSMRPLLVRPEQASIVLGNEEVILPVSITVQFGWKRIAWVECRVLKDGPALCNGCGIVFRLKRQLEPVLAGAWRNQKMLPRR